MTQEQKDLLLKDLCARLPYGIKGLVTFNGNIFKDEDRTIDGKLYDRFAEFQDSWYDNVTIKPYLFPLSSMTREQEREWQSLMVCDIYGIFYHTIESFDYLYKNHIDIRGLIPMGLAIDATDKNIY